MRKTTFCFALAAGLLGTAAAWAGWEEGVAAFKAGNYQQAVREFEQTVAERPEWPTGHLMLGTALMRLNRNAQAIDSLRKAYDLNPGDAGAQLTLAQAYVAAERYGEAAQLLAKVNSAALSKDQQTAYGKLYTIALEKTGQSDRALTELGKSARANPNDAALQLRYGIAAFNAGDTASAVSALERAAALKPRDPAILGALTKALIKQARENRGGNDAIYAKAVASATTLQQVQPSYDNLMLLGEAQLGGNQYDAASATFQQAAGQRATDWLPLYYAGQALTAKGSYDQATAILGQARGKAAAGREQTLVLKQLGFVYEKQKKFAEAKQVYQAAGDSAGLARVQQNEEIAKHNVQADAEAAKAKELAEQARKLREELAKQGGGTPPPQ